MERRRGAAAVAVEASSSLDAAAALAPAPVLDRDLRGVVVAVDFLRAGEPEVVVPSGFCELR